MALTALQVESAGSGKPKALAAGKKHPDGDNLYLEVRNATSKSWTGRYTIAGKERWIGIGPAKDISLKRARELHAENRRLVAEGIDPREHRKAQQTARTVEAAKAVTFEEIGDRFIAAHEAEWRNAKHRQQWTNTLKTYVYPVIGKLPPSAIDPALAMKVLESIWRRVPETGGRVRGRCEQIWDAAKAQKLCSGENPFLWRTLKHLLPAKGKIHKVVHHAAVPYSELPELMGKLRERSSVSARALEFAILCASRPNEVAQAVGGEFDLARGRWTIPGSRMKAGKDHVVMLSKRAVEILGELHPDGMNPDAPVFGITGAALTKMLELAGYGDATVHGTARASFKTWADEATAFKDAVSEACLAHVEGDKVKAAYARGEFEQQRQAMMEMWSQHCASTPADVPDNVVQMMGVG
jgi:integrase